MSLFRLHPTPRAWNWFQNHKNGRYTNCTKRRMTRRKQEYCRFSEIRFFVPFVYLSAVSCETASKVYGEGIRKRLICGGLGGRILPRGKRRIIPAPITASKETGRLNRSRASLSDGAHRRLHRRAAVPGRSGARNKEFRILRGLDRYLVIWYTAIRYSIIRGSGICRHGCRRSGKV